MAEQAATRSLLDLLCENLTEAIIGINLAGQIDLVNPPAETALGVPAADLLGRAAAQHPALQPLLPLLEGAPGEEGQGERVPMPGGVFRARRVIGPDGACMVILSPQIASSLEAGSPFSVPMRDMVHALKTPIGATKGFVELIEVAGPLTEQQATFTRRAVASMESMLVLINQLIDLSWVGSGEELRRRPVELNELARRVAAQFESYAQLHGVPVELDLGDEACWVEADQHRLESVLSNLISNAIKYSPQGGPVCVAVRPQGGAAHIAVQDHGLGIPPEHLPRIFDLFYRVHRPETRRIEGSGLGLAIVKAIVEKHGSSIEVNSTPGEGTVFAFALPILHE